MPNAPLFEYEFTHTPMRAAVNKCMRMHDQKECMEGVNVTSRWGEKMHDQDHASQLRNMLLDYSD
jgi:hypothetical protein